MSELLTPTVLIVEPNDAAREVISRSVGLALPNLQVVTCKNISTALNICVNRKIDLLLVDIAYNEDLTTTFIEAIRWHNPGIKLILVTSRSSFEGLPLDCSPPNCHIARMPIHLLALLKLINKSVVLLEE